MKEEVINQLLDINRLFYQTFALQFSATRQRIQPGVKRALEAYLPAGALDLHILDIGCGNGELARYLAQERSIKGVYIGLDSSPGLLEAARPVNAPDLHTRFIQADLASPDWDTSLPTGLRFNLITSFAVLHHIPGQALRRQVLQRVHERLLPEGYYIQSVWQFLNSARLRERIQPWEAAGLTPGDVEEGDYLLDWRHGGQGLRYVHHYSTAELTQLASEAGFRVIDEFHSDGEGGNLGLYQVWQPV